MPGPDTTFDERGQDPRTVSDRWRVHGRVAPEASGGWVVLGHEEAVIVATDPQTFSSAVSHHLQVPNGLDGSEHTAFRAVTDPFFTPDRMAALEPLLRRIADALVSSLPDGSPVDAVADIGAPFAVRAQTGWLGWPPELEPKLLSWMNDNHAATRSGDRKRTAAVAVAFDALINEALAAHRPADSEPAAPGQASDDATADLLDSRVEIDGRQRPLAHDEVVSVLRNWTGGDLGSISLCVGVVLHDLASDPQLQDRARRAERAELAAIVDELLRRDDPFVSSRRVATCPVRLGGREIGPGQRVRIQWTSVNRDETVMGDPDAFSPQHNATRNLVYGIGPHVCPGRPLATLELCMLTESLLRVFDIETTEEVPTVREVSPVGGYASVGLRLRSRSR